MKRKFSYITVGKILDELKIQGINIVRATFKKMEKEGFWQSKRTHSNWRVYTPEQAVDIIKKVKNNFAIIKGGSNETKSI